MMSGTRPGFSLVISTLLLLLLSILVAGNLFLATQELRTVRARSASLQARLAAESGILAALAEWPYSRVSELEVAHPASLLIHGQLNSRSSYSVFWEKLGHFRLLLRAEGSALDPGGETARTTIGLVVVTLDTSDVRQSFPAALATPGTVRLARGAQIAISDIADAVPALDACSASHATALLITDSLALESSPPARVSGAVRVDPAAWPDLATTGFGGISTAALRRAAQHVIDGQWTPRPALQSLECDRSDPANWGAPLDPTSVCGDFFPLIYVPGDLTMDGGSGQGVLIVDGNLELRSAARFHGLVLVRGNLVADSASLIAGAVTLASVNATTDLQGAALLYHPCLVRRVLVQAAVFRHPFLPSGRAWVPVF